jgi:hypothetical protein
MANESASGTKQLQQFAKEERRRNSVRSLSAKEWLKNAREQQAKYQVFSAYFSAYIALVCCSTQIMSDNGLKPKGDEDKWEGQTITKALNDRRKEISAFLQTDSGKKIKEAIWQREIPEDRNATIMGAGNDLQLSEATKTLDKYFMPGGPSNLNDDEMKLLCSQIALLFRKVRNRLFHGEKTYDERGDNGEFLEKLNPLLIEIVEILQRH